MRAWIQNTFEWFEFLTPEATVFGTALLLFGAAMSYALWRLTRADPSAPSAH